jgi:hypothetical protein
MGISQNEKKNLLYGSYQMIETIRKLAFDVEYLCTIFYKMEFMPVISSVIS